MTPADPPEIAVARLLNTLRFEEAEALLAAWLAERPGDLRGRANLAKLRMMQGRFAEAHELYAALAQDSPDTASFHACAGQAAAEAGDGAAAEAAFARALALKPDNPYYLRLLERHRLKRGDVVRAERLYVDRLEADPDDLNALLALGTIRSARAAPGAADLLERACRVAPDLARPWLSLGGERARRGEGEAAEAAFARGVAFDLREGCTREAREKRISLFPCLDILHHAGLIALGRNAALGSALADFTRKQAEALADPRTFHDISSIDSLHLEFSYEEALAFRLDRLAAAGAEDPLSAEARSLRAAARALDPALEGLSGLNLRRRFDATLAQAHAARERLGPPSRLAAVIACAERREFKEACGEFRPPDLPPEGRGPSGPPDTPAAGKGFFSSLLDVALGHCALRAGAEAAGRARLEAALGRFAAQGADPAFPWPAAAALGEAWAAQFLADHPRANRRYLDYLAVDPDLSITRLLAADFGWFLMQ